MVEEIYLKIKIVINGKNECSEKCRFSFDDGSYCNLFERFIGNAQDVNIRCDDCINCDKVEITEE